MLTSRLTQKTPAAVRTIAQTLADAGYKAWAVGGCIRDSLMSELLPGAERRTPGDWDIATNALPKQVARLFRKVVPTGLEHGTVTVLIDRVGYEVTTLRAECGYSDGRRPDSVEFVDDIAADLARRDLTVNAIAFDPLEQQLIDPFDGISDLRRRILRAVGDAEERFREDGLRVLRAARFVATLDFSLEEKTRAAIRPTLDSFRKVSPERVRQEWLKTMNATRPSLAFDVMRDEGMLAVTAPELLESVGCEQNRYHAYDVWGHSMACLDACPPSAVLRVSALLHDIGKPRSREFSDKTKDYTFYNHELIGAEMAGPILERLKFSNADRDRIVKLVRHHLICYTSEWSDAAVRRWLRRVTPEVAEDLYELGKADAVGKGTEDQGKPDIANLEELKQRVARLVEEGAALGVGDLHISGKDLMSEVGLKPGPVIGKILRELLEEVTEDPSRNQRDTLMARARTIAENCG